MLEQRIHNLLQIKDYIKANSNDWQEAKLEAERMNGWFTQSFVEIACNQISEIMLNETSLRSFATDLVTAEKSSKQYSIGITMAGNIPLVGFHDFLCVYLSGHAQRIKLSSKDNVLIKHLIQLLYNMDAENNKLISVEEMLKGCDAYIATGSNSSAHYFEQYFAKYPHIIRRNRSSIGILKGNESNEELKQFADDVYQYFGLGCRNVTKMFVPKDYDFIPLLEVFKKYDALKHHNKYRNNIDYNLALFMLNNMFYMSNESIILSENNSLYSAIGVLNYQFYDDNHPIDLVQHGNDIQAIIGRDYTPFGNAQKPSIFDFADGVNTINFLNSFQ
jgi:Acyl-CoA reductase (LuxC)